MRKQPSTDVNRRMESDFRKLGRKLDDLVARTQKAEAAARVKYAGQLRTLKARQEQAKTILARLRRRGAAAGPPLKEGLGKAWRDLSDAVREASKRYRETV